MRLIRSFFGDLRADAKADPRTMPERILDAILNKKAIVNCDRDVYLHRWYVIRTESFGLFIHKFVRSDEDRALHDHPWAFIVIPIWRGYMEHSDIPCSFRYPCINCAGSQAKRGECRLQWVNRVWPIFGTRCRPATYRHRVELFSREVSPHTRAICGEINPALPAWSIFIRFRKVREWGFWEAGERFVQWAAFWKEKCE